MYLNHSSICPKKRQFTTQIHVLSSIVAMVKYCKGGLVPEIFMTSFLWKLIVKFYFLGLSYR